jgi:prevent-host-death family protein
MQVGAFEAKNTLGSLLDRVEQGEEIVITRHGKAVARLAPCESTVDRQQVEAALARIRARAGKLHGPPATWDELKPDRDLGRP